MGKLAIGFQFLVSGFSSLKQAFRDQKQATSN